MSRLKRIGCLGLSVGVGLLLVTLLHSGLAWASGVAESSVPAVRSRVAMGVRWLPPGSPDAASVVLTKTVGANPNVCATTDSAALAAGSTAVYCYFIRNTGTVTLTNQFLVDNRLGTILNNFPLPLAPGATAYLTQSAVITQMTVNSAIWTATNPSLLVTVSVSDQATVTVILPSIALTKTVGLNPSVCPSTSTVTLTVGGGNVIYCYKVGNTGPITMTHHDLVDNRLGTVLNNFPLPLAPGATAYLTQSATITQTTVNTATWTSRSTFSVLVATAVDAATVVIERKLYLPLIKR